MPPNPPKTFGSQQCDGLMASMYGIGGWVQFIGDFGVHVHKRDTSASASAEV